MRNGQALLLILLLTACGQPPAEPTPQLDLWLGQMLMVGFRGTRLEAGDPFLDQVRDLKLGGVIYFDRDVPSGSPLRNIESADQLKRLTETLQSVAVAPLLVAIDQEGGRVARLKPERGFPQSLSQAKLGELNDEEATRAHARSMADALASVGVNLNFAPVLDLAVHPENPVIAALERSYGADPDLVARHARWTIEELHAKGILVGVKHFPGHGSSRSDSHLGLPDVTDYWSDLELKPFHRLISDGQVDIVMTAHLFNSRWDTTYPATLSPAVISGVLRDELGFEGVVVSDDLQMAAISENFTFEKSLVLAVLAGLDILVLSNNQQYDPEIAPRALRVLREAVERGEIPVVRLRESYERIRRLKEGL